ncbi:MAG: hypothetical protein KDJ48_03760, partial [Nitratireductor sp.]|nr:hypothetical protein [Nitratireductor sp.]
GAGPDTAPDNAPDTAPDTTSAVLAAISPLFLPAPCDAAIARPQKLLPKIAATVPSKSGRGLQFDPFGPAIAGRY